MTYEQAISYLDGTQKFGWKPGLKTITRLMHELGDPQNSLRYVHVAGTNGKGSTAAFISAVLSCAGYKTGLYISPHIQRFSERMSCDGVEITNEEVAKYTEIVKAAAERIVADGVQHPTEFELITAIAFVYFAQKRCDIVVLEVGLGGRLDATNVIAAPVVSVITNIGLDHTDYLGTTLGAIAAEKGGIIKQGSDVVLYGQSEEVERTISEICNECHATLTIADASKARVVSADVTGTVFDYDQHKAMQSSLAGLYQIPNAVTAIAALDKLRERGYEIPEEAYREGLRRAVNIGRFELMRQDPTVVIDGAHNPQGVEALAATLRKVFPGKKIRFITGMLSDKDYVSSLKEIAPLAKHFATITPPSERALSSVALAEKIRALTGLDALAYETPKKAIAAEIEAAKPDDVICVLGSLYQIGEIRDYFGK